jgi:hypothetical protein
MSTERLVLHDVTRHAIFALAVACGVPAFAEPNARAILAASAEAMGGDAPSSSDAVGMVHIVEGETARDGTIRVVTRGRLESNDIIDAGRHQEQLFLTGRAIETDAGSVRQLNKERTASALSAYFPLILIRSLLDDPDTGYEYVGAETEDGRACDHVRTWNTFASQRGLAGLTPVTIKDFWIDAATNLPVRIGFKRWDAQGSIWGVPVVILYSDFTNHDGKFYPHTVQKNLNGTPWTFVHFDAVTLDAAIPDGAFAGE